MTFLIQGENIIKRFGQSRVVHTKFYLAAIALFLVQPVYALYFSAVKLPIPDVYLLAAAAGTGILLIAVAEMKRKFGSYYITNYRVVSIRGILKKTMDSCTYDKIVNVKVVQSLPQRMLGMGTIDITTYQKTEILLSSVGNPTGIEKLIYSTMEGRSAHRQGQAQEPAKQPQAQPQPPAREQPDQPAQAAAQPQGKPVAAPENKPPDQQATEVRAQPGKKKRFGLF